MAVSASQLSEYLKSVFPADRSQMNLTPIMVPSGRTRFAGDEIIGYGESGPMYAPRFEPEMTFGGYYSPYLGRNLTAEEIQHVIPITDFVEGQGQVNAGALFPGEKAIAAFKEMGITGSQLSGQTTPGGFQIYPLAGTVATDQGDRTNIAIRYGESGAPEASAYQSGTLFGNAKVDKIVDQLAKAANAALLTYTGGLALGPLGAGVLSAPLAGAAAGIGQAAIKGGDTKDLLTGAISGYLQAPGAAEATAASDLAKIEASMGTPAPDVLAKAVSQAPITAIDITNPASAYNTGDLTRAQWETLPYDERWGYLNRMVQGNIPKDLSFDLNQDGFVNSADTDLRIFDKPLPPLVNEPVLVPGDNRLVSTLAQPPLAVENIAGQLTPESLSLLGTNAATAASDLSKIEASLLGGAQEAVTASDLAKIEASMLGGTGDTAASDLAKIEASMGTPASTGGDPTKAALYSNEGYGPLSDQTVTGAPITSSPITSLGPAATLKDVTDYLTGGAFAGSVTNALKEAFKAATGGGQQQGGGGLGGLGPIIGGLLSRAPTAAPSASVTPGRPVDITSPIQSLLAPKLVQQRPVTLL